MGTSGVHTLIIYGSSEQIHVYWQQVHINGCHWSECVWAWMCGTQQARQNVLWLLICCLSVKQKENGGWGGGWTQCLQSNLHLVPTLPCWTSNYPFIFFHVSRWVWSDAVCVFLCEGEKRWAQTKRKKAKQKSYSYYKINMYEILTLLTTSIKDHV